MNKAFHVIRQGQHHGSRTFRQIEKQLASGILRADDVAWVEDTAEWMPLSKFVLHKEFHVARQTKAVANEVVVANPKKESTAKPAPVAEVKTPVAVTMWRNWACGISLVCGILFLVGGLALLETLEEQTPLMDTSAKMLKAAYEKLQAVAGHSAEDQAMLAEMEKALARVNQPLLYVKWLMGINALGLIASIFLKRGHGAGVVLTGLATLGGLALIVWVPDSQNSWVSFGVYGLATFLGCKGRAGTQRPTVNRAAGKKWNRLEEDWNRKVWKI